MILDLKQEIELLTNEKVKLDEHITSEQQKLKERLQSSKAQLNAVNKKLKRLQKEYAQQQWKEWLLTDVTIQDLYNRIDKLKTDDVDAYGVILHITPLTQSNKTFYKLTQNAEVLRNTYSLSIGIIDGEVVIANVYKMHKKHPYMEPECIACYYHSLDFTTEQNEKALYDVFAKYVELRNKCVV